MTNYQATLVFVMIMTVIGFIFAVAFIDQANIQTLALACVSADKEWKRTENGPYRMECVKR